MKSGKWHHMVIISVVLLTWNKTSSQSLINSAGNTVENNTISIEYSIGEIGINTLSGDKSFIMQGLLQPIVKFKDCNLLRLIPNAFTPNKDNLNDCFGVKNWPVISNYQLEVYNRWGQVMFKTSNILECWNGDFNGQPQPMGGYVYIIKANTSVCGQISTKGAFVLIR